MHSSVLKKWAIFGAKNFAHFGDLAIFLLDIFTLPHPAYHRTERLSIIAWESKLPLRLRDKDDILTSAAAPGAAVHDAFNNAYDKDGAEQRRRQTH